MSVLLNVINERRTLLNCLLSELIIVCAVMGVFSISNEHHQCQETIVKIKDKMARCPSGTYVEVQGDNAVCKCGIRKLLVVIVPKQVPAPTTSSSKGTWL